MDREVQVVEDRNFANEYVHHRKYLSNRPVLTTLTLMIPMWRPAIPHYQTDQCAIPHYRIEQWQD